MNWSLGKGNSEVMSLVYGEVMHHLQRTPQSGRVILMNTTAAVLENS